MIILIYRTFPIQQQKPFVQAFSDTQLCSFIMMKCECFSYITDPLDYLQNNLLIAYLCGFNILKPLPSYWMFERFIKTLDNKLPQKLMHNQVLKLVDLGIIDTSFITLYSTPVSVNTAANNPKSYKKNKFSKNYQPKSGLGVHTVSNQINERNYKFYWGCKNHILTDRITGLPIYELTTTADTADCSTTLSILRQTNKFLSVE